MGAKDMPLVVHITGTDGEGNEVGVVAPWDETGDGICTCTYGAYAGYAGGTGWDIVRYDPACPEHGDVGPDEYIFNSDTVEALR